MGPHDFAKILQCRKYASHCVESGIPTTSSSGSGGSKEKDKFPDIVLESIEYGDLLHESIQFILTDSDGIEESRDKLIDELEAIDDSEVWSESIITMLPESSEGKQAGMEFGDGYAWDLKEAIEDFISFIQRKQWFDYTWEAEHNLQGEIQTKWADDPIPLNGYIDLRGTNPRDDSRILIELKSPARVADSWRFQAGLYAEMAQSINEAYQEIVVWSPNHSDYDFPQPEAIQILRERTQSQDNDFAGPISYLCKGCPLSCEARIV